jgi:hypothetical protein
MVKDEKDSRFAEKAKSDTNTSTNESTGQTTPGFTSGVSGPNADVTAGGGKEHPLAKSEQLRQEQERQRVAEGLEYQEQARQQMAADTKIREETQKRLDAAKNKKK